MKKVLLLIHACSIAMKMQRSLKAFEVFFIV